MKDAAIIVFIGLILCTGLGVCAGYILGRLKGMTRREAARVMAKASWRKRLNRRNK